MVLDGSAQSILILAILIVKMNIQDSLIIDYDISRGFGGSIDHKVTIVLFMSKMAIILL